MIPKKLTFKGLYSYQEKQEIDFTRLTDAQIFGIFGPVGSGKSTILEAISFALYGETERLNARENRAYNMMNLKSSEMLIQFEFMAGKGLQESYLFEVKARRNKNHHDKISTADRRHFKEVDGEWVAIEKSAEEVVGLSYKNFQRTIIIPQGKFQEFLQLGAADRTRMLKEIFQLQKYELLQPASRLAKKNDAALIELNTRLDELGDIGKADVKAQEKRLKEITKTLKTAEKNLKKLEKQADRFRELKNLFEKITGQSERLDELKAQEEDYQNRENKLKDYEDCRLRFSQPIGREKTLSEEIARTTETLNEFRERKAALAAEEKTLSGEFEKIRKAYLQRDKLREMIEDLEKIAEIRSLTEAQSASEKTFAAAAESESFLEKDLERLRKQQKKIRKQLKALRGELAEASQFEMIRQWYHQNELLAEQQQAQEALVAEQQSISQKKRDEMNELLATFKLKATAPAKDPFSALKKELAEKISAQQSDLQHLQLQKELGNLAHTLEDGQPCPLCGALDHPEKMSAEKIDEQLAKNQKKLAALNVDMEKLQGVEKEYLLMRATFQATEAQFAKDAGKLTELLADRDAHKATFQWPAFLPEDRSLFDRAVAELTEKQDQLKSAESEQEDIETALQESENRRENLRRENEAVRSGFQQTKAKIETLKSQLKVLAPADRQSADEASLQREITKLQADYRSLEANYLQAQEKREAISKEISNLSGEINSREGTLRERETAYKENEKALKQALKKSRFKKLEIVEDILAVEVDVTAERQALNEYRESLKAAEALLKSLKKDAAGKSYDAAAHEKLDEEISDAREKHSEFIREEGVLSKSLTELKERIERKGKLLEEQESLQLRGENIRTLVRMFHGSGFVNFVSTIFLDNLCRAANDRFHRLTRQQLQLEINANNEFQIRDFLNDGQLRSVKTLSGGQTFQASLSLALALADNVQQLSGSGQNFFFLDEGFGTLDKDALRTVFETLKSLRKEQRIVGVISHVEELQQEIEVCLRIENDPLKGSSVSPSWE